MLYIKWMFNKYLGKKCLHSYGIYQYLYNIANFDEHADVCTYCGSEKQITKSWQPWMNDTLAEYYKEQS